MVEHAEHCDGDKALGFTHAAIEPVALGVRPVGSCTEVAGVGYDEAPALQVLPSLRGHAGVEDGAEQVDAAVGLPVSAHSLRLRWSQRKSLGVKGTHREAKVAIWSQFEL